MTPAKRRGKRSKQRPEADEDESAAPAESADASSLAEYEAMRDFARTPEPSGGSVPGDAGPLTFVVQKHDATRLHYDLRIEVDGAMPSWPVPRAPSPDPAERRLAIQTEDHPLDYATFEGIIPKGEYGAGEVIVWDNGTYSPDESEERATDGKHRAWSFGDREEAERRVRDGIAAGKLSLTFRGKRLKGSYALVKTSQGDRSWLLLKHRGDDAVEPGRDFTGDDTSVISGLTIEDIRGGHMPDRGRRPVPARIADLDGVRRGEPASDLRPMQATLGDTPFSNAAWIFEPKFDGIRALVHIEAGRARLFSRTGNELTAQYPVLAQALSRQPASTLVLDGEIVAPDERGVPSFQRLQERMNLMNEVEVRQAEARIPVVFYVFDIVYLDGFDLRRVPLHQRKELLARVLQPSPRVRLIEHFLGEGETAFEASVALGFEGVVAKRRDSIYEAGRRSRSWLKIKSVLSDDFVIVGYTPGNGARASTFGSLLLGQYEEAGVSGSSVLAYTGRVGTGFDDALLRSLRATLDNITIDMMPLAEEPPDATGAIYVRPDLVAEVQFAERTDDGHLRAPSFGRLRPDKPASEVLRSIVEHTANARATGASIRGASRDGVSHEADVTSTIEAVLDQLDELPDGDRGLTLAVGGEELRVSNLDKVMWPATAEEPEATKRDLLRYYARVWPWIAPHLRDRPVTLTRYPNGIEGKYFYQKHYEGTPDVVETVPVFSDSGGGAQEYVLCNNLPTLLWLGQLADLALHTSLARASPEPDGHELGMDFASSKEALEASLLNHPDFVLFDLDPCIYAGFEGMGEEPELNRAAFHRTVQVAQWLKALLDSASLSSFVKTSGATGLHIYVPILRRLDYPQVRAICETFGTFLLRAHPADVTMEWSIEKRAGKVFLDLNQNARIKNLAAPLSPRTKPGAPVSMTLRWDELGEIYPTDFTIRTAIERLETVGDPWVRILEAKHDLASLLEVTE